MADYQSTTPDGNCIFCAIVSGEITTPGIFWEDNNFMAFLSTWPNCEGNTVVIPKKHFKSDIFSMPTETLQNFIVATKKVSKILEGGFENVGRIGVIIEGTGIDHAHIKLYPLHQTQYLKENKWQQVLCKKTEYFTKYEGYLSSIEGPEANKEDLSILAKKLKKFSNTLSF